MHHFRDFSKEIITGREIQLRHLKHHRFPVISIIGSLPSLHNDSLMGSQLAAIELPAVRDVRLLPCGPIRTPLL
ncbi:MAG: hypothetical protein R6U78_15505 [Bacteroidales bacterium]